MDLVATFRLQPRLLLPVAPWSEAASELTRAEWIRPNGSLGFNEGQCLGHDWSRWCTERHPHLLSFFEALQPGVSER